MQENYIITDNVITFIFVLLLLIAIYFSIFFLHTYIRFKYKCNLLRDNYEKQLTCLSNKNNVCTKVVDENLLMSAEIVDYFRSLSIKINQAPSNIEWTKLKAHVTSIIPDFIVKINRNNNLREEEIRLCILVRLHFSPSAIAVLLNVSKQSVSTTRTRLLSKIYGIKQGRAKDLDRKIASLN